MAGDPVLKRADPRTIQDKVLVGYQGWFTCAGDGEPIHPGHHGWLHWFHDPIPSGGRPNTDIWPDVSDYDPSELFPAPGLATASGDPVHLFSSRNPKTVRRHFHWMALHGVDGAFLQRFAGQCEVKAGNSEVRNLRDEVGERVREAAEAEGRVFAIMYDVSGVAPDKIQNILEQDWVHLLHDQHILDSPNYLRENDRPVVALWGFGLDGRKHTPELVRAITDFFRSSTPGGVYLVAGTAGHWRTANSDADRNPDFVQVWTDCFDAISPWTVGRYNDEESADRWGEQRVKADVDYLKKLEAEGGRKVDYMPVVLPGGSGFNLSEGKWGMNDTPRNGGRFLWRQICNARRAGVRMIYGAMWDEYDEGTAFMPVVSYSSQLPVHRSYRFVALDIDGHDLPSDWYMRIIGYAAEAFHGERTLQETFPVKELQDYWSTRPPREPVTNNVDEVTRAFRGWEVSEASGNASSEAPPPYSLEDASSHSPTQQRPPPAAPGGGRPPAVRADTRPSAGFPVVATGGVAAPLAAAAVAHTLSGGSTRYGPVPPVVDMSSRPLGPHRSTSAGPPAPPAKYGDPRAGGHVSPSSVGHVPARPSQSPMPMPGPNSAVGFPVPCAVGEYSYGRGRPGSRHRSTSRSRSRSSSGSRKDGHSSPPAVRYPTPPAHPSVYRPPPGRQSSAYRPPSVPASAYRPPPGPPSSVYSPPLGPPTPTLSAYPAPQGPPAPASSSYPAPPGQSAPASSAYPAPPGPRVPASSSYPTPPAPYGLASPSCPAPPAPYGSSSFSEPAPPAPYGSSSSSEPAPHAPYGSSSSSYPPPPGPPVPARPPQSHGHGYIQSAGPDGHAYSAAFPGAALGMTYTHSESTTHGPVGYGPLAHSYPVGQGGPMYPPSSQGTYPGQAQSSYSASGYDVSGYGPGYPQQPGYGYVPQPSSPYYASHSPGTTAPGPGAPAGSFVGGSGNGSGNWSGSGNGSGSGKTGIQGGIASALNAVENVAGRSTRNKLEKLTNNVTGSSLFNKFK